MRVAAIYDIHGNLPALESVLDEVHGVGVDLVVVGGDVVPGPMPRECVLALLGLELPVRFIHGNGERDVLALRDGRVPVRVPPQFIDAMRWVTAALPDEHLAEMAEWPLTLRMEIAGLGRVLFCHATPVDDNQIFTEITPEERLAPVMDAADADIVICGHTHMQFDRTVGGTRVVNAGSVGMPFAEPGAYWILLGPGVEVRRTAYNFEAADARIRKTGYPQPGGFEILSPPRGPEMLKIFERAALG